MPWHEFVKFTLLGDIELVDALADAFTEKLLVGRQSHLRLDRENNFV